MRYIYACGAAYSAPYMPLPGAVVFGAEHGSKLPPISRVAGLPSPETSFTDIRHTGLRLGNRFIHSTPEMEMKYVPRVSAMGIAFKLDTTTPPP